MKRTERLCPCAVTKASARWDIGPVMGSDVSLWGTFSVLDHRRPRPFVADVLLYDKLVVPVPNGDEEWVRWTDLGREPDVQAELLGIIGRDLTVPVPWTLARHREWAARCGAPSDPGVEASVRDEIAKAVSFDAVNVESARQTSPSAGSPMSAGDPDDPGYAMTRMILADEYGSARDRAIVDRIPRADEVDTVVAYGSYSDFVDERGVLEQDLQPGSQPVFTCQWPFFVPDDSDLSDKELLRRAVELAHADQIVDWRAAVQRWRRDAISEGQPDANAQQEMEAMIAEYAEAARKLKIKTAVRSGVFVLAAVGGAAAVLFPPAGITSLFGLVALRPPPSQIPRQLDAAAMFYEARKRFH